MPLTYKEALTFHEEIDVLYLFDLPQNLDELRKIVHKTKPCVIHACFYVENSVYLSSFPTREDFKWLYSLIWKRKELNIRKDLQAIINAKGWTKDSIMFMLKVFSELEFVNISNGIIALNSSPQKKDLQEAHIYQERVKQIEIEKCFITQRMKN